MADTTNYRYGVIRTLDEAREAAADAEAEGLLGYYPAACVVLARELKRWEAAHAEWLEAQRTDGVAPSHELQLPSDGLEWLLGPVDTDGVPPSHKPGCGLFIGNRPADGVPRCTCGMKGSSYDPAGFPASLAAGVAIPQTGQENP